MSITFVHMVRGIELGYTGAGAKHIQPLQAKALRDVPFIPWLNTHHSVTGPEPGTGWQLEYERTLKVVETMTRDDRFLWGGSLGQAAEELYLDIEGIMRPEYGYQPGVETVHLGAILNLRRALTELVIRNRARIRVFIYSNLQGRFRMGDVGPEDDVHPNHPFHALIDPYVDGLVASCYNAGKTLQEDLEEAGRLVAYYNQEHVRNGRPLMVFFWRYSMGRPGIVPMPEWKKYTATIIEQLRHGDYVCLFGAAKHPFLDEPYAEAAEWLKELIAAQPPGPATDGHDDDDQDDRKPTPADRKGRRKA